MAWVYVLRGTTGRLYIGSTGHLAQRLRQHETGQVQTTRRLGRPLELVGTREFASMAEARTVERRLKSWHKPERVLAWAERSTVE